MWKNLIVAIISSLITFFGPPIYQKFHQPVLEKEVYALDVDRISDDEIQKKITVLPVQYTLKHKTGGTAKNGNSSAPF